MDTKEFERILLEGAEQPKIEYKGPVAWSNKLFIKDILAMANIKDGGYIIVGISENKHKILTREGLTPEQISTYKIDDMREQIKKFVEPSVNFTVSFLKDSKEKKYVLIHVQEFELLPVVCSASLEDVKPGHIYFRTSRGCPKSEDITHSIDMRDIIERSAIKMIRHWENLGLATHNKNDVNLNSKLDLELGDFK